MDIVVRSKELMLTAGAAPIMWLMLALSVASFTVILERLWFFHSIRVDVRDLTRTIAERLHAGDRRGALRVAEASASAEAAIVAAGLRQVDATVAAVTEAMESATALERMRLERNLAFLGTLGSNAPFVGLLGTVVGIMQAFEALAQTTAAGNPPAAVMGAIAEALVATAIGLAVAIPAVAAYNALQRRVKATLGRADALRHVLLSHLQGGTLEVAPPTGDATSNSTEVPTLRGFDTLPSSVRSIEV